MEATRADEVRENFPILAGIEHIVIEANLNSLNSVRTATGQVLGLWPERPPLLNSGLLDIDEMSPFSEWRTQVNQKYLDELFSSRLGHFYCNERVLVDCLIAEQDLNLILPSERFTAAEVILDLVPAFLHAYPWIGLVISQPLSLLVMASVDSKSVLQTITQT